MEWGPSLIRMLKEQKKSFGSGKAAWIAVAKASSAQKTCVSDLKVAIITNSYPGSRRQDTEGQRAKVEVVFATGSWHKIRAPPRPASYSGAPLLNL